MWVFLCPFSCFCLLFRNIKRYLLNQPSVISFSLNWVWPFSPSFGILKMLIILNWNLRLIVVPIIGCLCINYTALRLWGVNLRERKWWKDSWWQNYEILASVRWRMDWGLSCAFCLFTFLCFCVLNIMHRENVWYSWLAWIHPRSVKIKSRLDFNLKEFLYSFAAGK